LELRPGDWVLLASDGICSLPGDEIADVAYRLRQSTPEEMAEALIAAVTQKGIVDQDNATVVAVRIDGAQEASRGVTTPMLAKPGEEVDLRTRRIGVSRRGPARRDGGKTRAAAVWLAAAAALVFCAVALMLAVPSLRPTLPSNPPSPAAAPSTPATGGDRAPAAALPALPVPGKSTSEPPASETSPPPTVSPDRPSDGQEGAGPLPAPIPVPAPPKSATNPPQASEGEGRAPSRPAAARPTAPGSAPSSVVRSGAPPGEGERPPRASVVRPAAPLPPGAKANPSAKPAPGPPAEVPGRSTSAGEQGSPRPSKEPSRPKPEVAPGPSLGHPKEDLPPRTDPLSNTEQ
jgi:hypothetical protein